MNDRPRCRELDIQSQRSRKSCDGWKKLQSRHSGNAAEEQGPLGRTTDVAFPHTNCDRKVRAGTTTGVFTVKQSAAS